MTKVVLDKKSRAEDIRELARGVIVLEKKGFNLPHFEGGKLLMTLWNTTTTTTQDARELLPEVG